MKRFVVTRTRPSSKKLIAKVVSRVIKKFIVTHLLTFETGRSLLAYGS